MAGRNILVLFQKLDGMPAGILDVRIIFLKFIHDNINLVFYVVFIDHGILVMMVMLMGRMTAIMMMDEGPLLCIFLMVCDCVHEYGQSGLLAGRDWNGRNPKHLGETVKVDLHSTFFHNIHHIKGQNDWLAQFD